jgi:hypothetical protein
MVRVALFVMALVLLLRPVSGFMPDKKVDPNEARMGDPEFDSTGVLLVDALLFDKLIPSVRVDIVLMILNKANIGKQATDYMREEFMAIAKKTKSDSKVLFAQMMLNGSDNKAQAERVGIENQQVGQDVKPEFFLYKKGEKNAIPIKPDSEDFSVADVMAYVSKTTGAHFTSRGTIKELSKLAEEFLATKAGSEDRKKVYQQAKEKAESYPTETTKKSAKEKVANAGWYVQTMEKIMEKDEGWVDKELSRLRSIIVSAKVSNSRKDEFKRRLNIVQVFKGAPVLVQYEADKATEGAEGVALE